MNIQVEIGRLVLEGIELSPQQRLVLQAAVETELGRLLAREGLAAGLAQGGALARVPTQTVSLTAPHEAAVLGQQIAQAVYRGMGR